MCFIIRLRDKPPFKASKTRKDIYAYKVFNYKRGKPISPYYTATWKVKEEKKANLVLTSQSRSIYEGLHCYRCLDQARIFSSGERGYHILKVLIPKGSYIYKNDYQIVSNRMILRSMTEVPKKKPNDKRKQKK